jgi:hypothetical protein
MAERFPTSEETQDFINALIASRTASTPASRLNYLQDWSGSVGFDPFGAPFQEQAFPEELYTPQTRSIYATDSQSPYAVIFDAIDQGIDPVSAARYAINLGIFDSEGIEGQPGSELDQDLRRDINTVAKEYANELKTRDRERIKWQNEQAKLRAAAPVTLNELVNPASRYDELSLRAGRPEGLTVEDLSTLYAQSRKAAAAPKAATPGGRAPHGRNIRGGQRAGTPAAQPVSEFLPGGKPGLYGPKAEIERQAFDRAATQTTQRLKNTPVWSPQAQQVMQRINLVGLLTGRGD